MFLIGPIKEKSWLFVKIVKMYPDFSNKNQFDFVINVRVWIAKRRWIDDIKTWTGLPSWDSINATVMDRVRRRRSCHDVSYSA